MQDFTSSYDDVINSKLVRNNRQRILEDEVVGKIVSVSRCIDHYRTDRGFEPTTVAVCIGPLDQQRMQTSYSCSVPEIVSGEREKTDTNCFLEFLVLVSLWVE